ncbi:LPS export ABC transporter permease LptG [Pseudoxanthomonas broegbernensis]|uniref:LPS export ABC transporter permease LptG n=1 Tax=Pseudoxanthomonas broegbernensis TaxID=83619 RepID=A0A7V8GMR8_9GAMM|nr:LPS export ABC transporter permease LptG [Pseudoxanthomonas broegbernensis]KAF1686588.1 LPS export ABC transporter permease LptG [Pseudoxanthomonas broegbernensis]MBB6063664.1 lipopolysaccharide export system permease protein [Pseudoxanthomonas broegbernensis]
MTLRLHDLYLGRMVLGTVLLAWAVLVGLDVVMALSGQLGDLGKGSYDFPTALAVVAYSVPRRAYTIFPYAAVIGALLGLGQLAATSELTALRALGLSRRRLSISAAAALALLTGLMVLAGETVAPWGQRQSDQIKLAAKTNNVAMARYSGLWAREGDTFLNAVDGQERMVDGQRVLELRDVRLYEVGDDGRLHALTRAARVVHDQDGWSLRKVRRVAFGAGSAREERVEEQRWESQLDANALAAGVTRPRNLSAADLQASIEYRRRNGLDARDYEDTYWSRWFYPVNVLALCLAAVPFAFGSLRSGGMGKRLFLGIVFSLGFMLLQMQFGRLAGAFRFDYRIAYALPPVLMLATSWWLFRRKSG